MLFKKKYEESLIKISDRSEKIVSLVIKSNAGDVKNLDQKSRFDYFGKAKKSRNLAELLFSESLE